MTKKFLLSIALAGVIGTGGGSFMYGAENTKQGSSELQVLVSAITFDDGVAGERPGNGQSATYLAYQKLVAGEPAVSISVLKELQKKATPAGQLYIAALIREHDSRAGVVALHQLYSVSSKVKYMSGCEVQEFSVGEIAKQLLENGIFQNFRLSVRCKT